MRSLSFSFFILLMPLLLACKSSSQTDGISFEDAWVRAMPPGMKMTAAYGRLTNHGDEKVNITAFSSDSFADVSLHETLVENGVSSMHQLPGLEQSAGSTTVLKPGGLHLMLMKPTRELHPGDRVSLTMIASDGAEYSFSLPLEAR